MACFMEQSKPFAPYSTSTVPSMHLHCTYFESQLPSSINLIKFYRIKCIYTINYLYIPSYLVFTGVVCVLFILSSQYFLADAMSAFCIAMTCINFNRLCTHRTHIDTIKCCMRDHDDASVCETS